MTDAEHDVITVDILGQRYPIRSSLDTTYVTELATYVDRKMQTAAEKTSGDSVRVAVLAALNIADEYFRYRKAWVKRGDADDVTLELEQLVDRALAGQ